MKTRWTFLILAASSVFDTACSRDHASPTSPHEVQNPAAKQTRDEEVLLPVAEQATAKIQIEAVKLSSAPEIVRLAGRIALADDRNWHVGVRTEGMIDRVSAGLGDRVKKGQVLAAYHADEVHNLRAQYRTATASLNRAQSGATLAQRNYERMQTLLSLKAASVLQVDQARQDVVSAEAEVQTAKGEVDRARKLLEHDLRVAAEPAGDDEAADEVPIIAPASGYIIEKNITPGKSITPSGADAFVIGDLSEVWMLASVRPEHLAQLKVGQPATVVVPGISGKLFPGKITSLGKEVDPATRVLEARIVLNNPGNLLRPEMLANAEIATGSGKPTLLVPSDAIQQINGGDAVFVRTAPDRFVVRAVRVGETVNGKTPVLEGLKPDEEIVVRGSFILKSQLLRASMESE